MSDCNCCEVKQNNNTAKIFLPQKEIDTDTMKQIKSIMENTILSHIRIMPDCHCSVGCVVGLTAIIKNKIIPRYVGVDIGCGISLYPLDIKIKEKKYPKVEQLIRHVVPMGDGPEGVNKEIQIRDSDWDVILEESNSKLDLLKEKFKNYDFPNKFDKEFISKMIDKIGGNYKKDLFSLGTLGGGNHYVEINSDENENLFLTVHSGSRNLGFRVCNYHQSKIDDYYKFKWSTFEKELKLKKTKNMNKKDIEKLEEGIISDLKENLHPMYLEGDEMIEYLLDMVICQSFASLNRLIMIRNIVENLESSFDKSLIIETKHNYIDFDRLILRKGSVSASKGERCIISLNMKDGILLCEGLGNPEWNYSSAHGCGRILSRKDASKLNMKQFEKEMKDVYSTSIRKETLDESPMAYRNVDLVKKCLDGSVIILKQLKPIINCKGWKKIN